MITNQPDRQIGSQTAAEMQTVKLTGIQSIGIADQVRVMFFPFYTKPAGKSRRTAFSVCADYRLRMTRPGLVWG